MQIAFVCCYIFLLLCGAYASPEDISFRPPYSVGTLSHWSPKGNARVLEESIQLTAHKSGQRGALWTTRPWPTRNWEVLIEFRITGGKAIGGDGLAFWYAETPNTLGPVYGSTDFWRGLGIFIDTFDNDGKGSSPLITSMVNDGSRSHISADDGMSQSMGSCSFPVRNLLRPSFLRIRNEDGALTVDFARQPGEVFQRCFSIISVALEPGMYFGLSAHTGEVSDRHEILSVQVRDLSSENSNAEVNHGKGGIKQSLHNTDRGQSGNTFQSSALTMLRQVQSGQSSIEATQLAMSEVIAQVGEQIEKMGQVILTGGATKGGNKPGSTLDARIVHVIQQIADDSQFTKSQIETALRGMSKSASGANGARSVSDDNALFRHVQSMQEKTSKELKSILKTALDEQTDQLRSAIASMTRVRSEMKELRAHIGSMGGSSNGSSESGLQSIIFWIACIISVVSITLLLSSQIRGSRGYSSQHGKLGWE